jgi:hypothetical protein
MGQRMPPAQGQAPQGQPAQGPQQGGQGGDIGAMVKDVGEGMQLLIKVFGTVGAPKEAIDMLNQSMQSFVGAIQLASGQQGEAPASAPDKGGSMPEAAGQPKARPMSPGMMG